MEKNKTKGRIKDIKGRVKRQAGEWTGNEDLQAEGTKEQIEGKAQNAVGQVKETGQRLIDEARQKARDVERQRDIERGRELEREREVHRPRGKKAA